MEKKRIIILMHYMETGGAETSLLGLLESIDYNSIDVDLFIYSHRGGLMAHIPEQANLLPEYKGYSLIEAPITTAVRNGYLRLVIARLNAKYRHKRHLAQTTVPEGVDEASVFGYVGKNVSAVMPDINPNTEYDLAVSFLTPHDYCLDHVRARKKVAWIHTDYSRTYVNARLEAPVWNAFDNIIAVSDDVARNFEAIFPEAGSKIQVIENILPKRYITNLANRSLEESPERGDAMLLSIGRFTYAKNFEGIASIAAALVRDYGIDVRWYIMGYGGDEELIRQSIVDAGMEQHVFIIGPRSNPYPWIKACDIYVQPSRYEGKSVTVREAQLLHKPVVITDYPTSASQVKDGVDGIIAPYASLPKTVSELLRDTARRESIVDYLTENDYAFTDQINNFYALIP